MDEVAFSLPFTVFSTIAKTQNKAVFFLFFLNLNTQITIPHTQNTSFILQNEAHTSFILPPKYSALWWGLVICGGDLHFRATVAEAA